jgi:hypothetical protein
MKARIQLKRNTLITVLLGSIVRCCSSSSAAVRTKVVLFYNDVYEVILPKVHGFPMAKYRLVREGYNHYPNIKC